MTDDFDDEYERKAVDDEREEEELCVQAGKRRARPPRYRDEGLDPRHVLAPTRGTGRIHKRAERTTVWSLPLYGEPGTHQKTGTLQGTADYLLPDSLLHKLGSNVATKNLPTSCYTGIGPLLKVLLLTGQRLIATSVPTRCYETTDRSTHETLDSLLRSHIALRHLALNSHYFSGN